MRKYYSNYTGKQIDEAVSTIIENQISLEDLSPELVATIKSWCTGTEEASNELEFKTHFNFPIRGDATKLYIATDEDKIYYWSTSLGGYRPIVADADFSNITLINCGGAKQDGGN
jgi:hypothetical protein